MVIASFVTHSSLLQAIALHETNLCTSYNFIGLPIIVIGNMIATPFIICLVATKSQEHALKQWQKLDKGITKEKEVIVYIRCRYCGAKTPETETHCSNCGAKL
jgi:ribosomal protein L40E